MLIIEDLFFVDFLHIWSNDKYEFSLFSVNIKKSIQLNFFCKLHIPAVRNLYE